MRAIAWGIVAGIGLLAAGEEGQENRSRVGMSVWDTGKASAEPLSPAAIAEKQGWTQVPAGQAAAAFKGDAVVFSGRIAAVFRRQAASVELHSGGEAAVRRAACVLLSLDGKPAARLERLALVENTRGGACLEAAYATARGASLSAKFRLNKGEVALETEPGAGAGVLRIECPGRFAVLPDFFADDIVIDARKIPPAAIEVPSENFILHPAGAGEAIAMAVFENRDQDVRLTLSGEGKDRAITGSEIYFGKGRKIWVGLLEGPQVWATADTLGGLRKVFQTDWKIPFRAQWRLDFTRRDELTDSSTLLLQEKKDGDFVMPSITGDVHSGWGPKKVSPETVRKGYHTGWADVEGQVHLMPPDWPHPLGPPVLLYPLNRTPETPIDFFTVVDLARACLGSGPCDYLLDLEGHKDQYKGRATCGVRDILGRIYSKNQQKEKRDEVEKCLKDGLTFVTHIRSRVAEYLEFGRKMRAYLAEELKAHPELQAPLEEFEKILKEMDGFVAKRQEKIQSPARVAEMNEEFRKNVLDYEGPDALDRCKKYTSALVEIGGNQDELVAECRRVVKSLRQRAGILMALEPRLAAVAGEVRTRTHEVLRNPAWHEGANK